MRGLTRRRWTQALTIPQTEPVWFRTLQTRTRQTRTPRTQTPALVNPLMQNRLRLTQARGLADALTPPTLRDWSTATLAMNQIPMCGLAPVKIHGQRVGRAGARQASRDRGGVVGDRVELSARSGASA